MKSAISLRLSMLCWITSSELCISRRGKGPFCSHGGSLEQCSGAVLCCCGWSVTYEKQLCKNAFVQGGLSAHTCAILSGPVTEHGASPFTRGRLFNLGFKTLCNSQCEYGPISSTEKLAPLGVFQFLIRERQRGRGPLLGA